MGNAKRRIAALAGLTIVGGLIVTGCASEATATSAPATTTPAPGDARGGDVPWPDGSDAETPSCQDASAAVLAVVNDSLHEASTTNGTVESVLPWLSAHPDTDLTLWTLTGLVENTETQQGTEGGYFVVFATDSDPTSPDFDGTISALGVATSMTTLPPLEPAYVGPTDMDDVPPAALGCGTQRAKQS
jgi:hypothetical protein